jgi:2-oxoglutarate ferredoxin oxidoreductase subunit alpha
MAIGASFAGVRAMTGSSGGGFALMVEGLSLAGITETPIVIAEAMRPGPATGLPTRTEQGDLLFILHTGHGEFPRVVLAPGTPEEAFHLTNRAFDLSEKYQIPVFVVFDQYLGDTQWTYDSFNTDGLVYTDYRLRGEAFAAQKDYNRYAYTESGITPLAVPGDAPHVVVADSDEHSEEGHIVEDAETRLKMMDKRYFRKMEALRKEMRPPLQYGSDSPEIVLVSWGSTYGVLKEAVDTLNAKGEKAALLHFTELYPFPETGDRMRLLEDARLTACVEGNATGQFARHMAAETGYEFTKLITKYDGRPFSVKYILERLK